MVTNEEWREALYWEGLYEVSNMGRVRNIQRWVRSKGAGRKLLPVVIRRPQLNRYGYPVVCLNGKAKEVLKSIHRMVAETFIGPIPDGMQVNHKDGDKTNNHLDNLEVCTGSHNQLHRHRVLGQNIGESHPHAKLTSAIVVDVLARLSRGETKTSIADLYGVNRTTIYHVQVGRTWGHLRGQSPMPSLSASPST